MELLLEPIHGRFFRRRDCVCTRVREMEGGGGVLVGRPVSLGS